MKKTNKKVLFVVALVAVLGLTACGNKNDNKDNNTDNKPSVETPAEDNNTTETPAEENNNADNTQANINKDVQAELDKIQKAVEKAYGEDYVATQPFDTATIEEKFGLSPDMYDGIIAQGPMISAHVDNLIAVHPTEGNHDAVVKALNDYREVLIADTLQYPSNLVKIKASRVEEAGDYVFFLMLGFADEKLVDEKAVLASYEAQNDIATKAIKEVVDK